MSKHTRWFLVSSSGLTIPLNQTMISFGKEGSDVVLQSRSVDKRHAVLTFDHYENCFKVKDLNSINGSYLNDIRIPAQTFVKLEHLDSLRFGFDLVVYQVQVVEHIPLPVSSNYQYYVWENGKLPHNPLCYPRQVVKMTDCKECLHKLTGHHTCGSYNIEWNKDTHSQPHHNHPSPDHHDLSLSVALDAPKNQVPMFNSTGDKQDFCGNFVPSQPHHHHHHHSGWGLDQITQRPLDVSIQSTSGRVAQGHPDVENKLYCQGNYGVPFYSSHSSAIRSSCEGSSAKQNEHRIGLQLGAEEMASSLSTATPNTSKINSDVHSNSDKISTDGNGTIVNCLQCNFSGDSLDLNQEDGPVAMQRSGKEVDLHDRRSLSHPEGDTGQKRKTLDSNSQIDFLTKSNVTKSEIPCTSSRDDGTFEPSFHLPLESEQSSTVHNNGLVHDSSDCHSVPDVTTPLPAADQDGSSESSKPHRLNCTAFTIDFTDVCAPSSSSKKLGIKDKISKFAPPKSDSESKTSHRRIPSLPKSQNEAEKKITGSQSLREELESPTAGIITAARAKLVVAGGGYLSDGHGSSDQDDSLSAKSDPVKKIEIDGVEVTQIGKPDKVKSFTTKKGRALPVVGLRDSAKYLIGKMFGQVTAPTNSPTEPSSPPLLQKGEKKKTWTSENNVAGHSTRGVKEDARRGDHKGVSNAAVYGVNVRDTNKISKPSKGSPKSLAEEEVEMQKVPCNNEDCEGVKRSDVIFNGSEQNGKNHQEDEESGDTISEAGTYTIENDQENDEEALARRNIDAVFGVGSHPSIANLQRPVVVPNISEGTDAEHCKTIDFTSEVALSQSVAYQKQPTGWLKEWVSLTADGGKRLPSSNQVSSHAVPETHPPNVSSLPGTDSQHEDYSRWSTSNAKVVPRQRRKLPIPPINRYTVTIEDSPSDSGNQARDRLWASSSSASESPEGQQSDGSMDTETILKETETVVSAMEARIDNCRQDVDMIDVESRDSGGESDVDTSTASTRNESLKTRELRVTNEKTRAWRAKSEQSVVDNSVFNASGKHNRRSSGKAFPCSTAENDYSCHSEGETASVHSDVSSSSDLSGSSPGSRRKGGPASAIDIEKPPLMRFNRAFSLRRARLGCDIDGGTAKTSASSLASSRPSSAGSTSSTKDCARVNVSSSRNDAQMVKPSSGGPFDRADGGRFSLRLPRGPPVLSRLSGKGAASNKRQDKSLVNPNLVAKTSSTPRSNSTLSAKELEMKNWRRRKEYDPLKAAAEGRKKDAAKKVVGQTGSLHSDPSHKSDPSAPVFTAFQRSASFHGTDGLIQLNTLDYKSEDDLGLRSANGSSLHSVITSDRGQKITMTRGGGHVGRNHQESRFDHRKKPEEDLVAEPVRNQSVPIIMPLESGCQMADSLTKHKSKIEALDNLVISTVHQVSRNLCSNAEGILKKLGRVHELECQESLGNDGLEELLSRIATVSSPETSPRGHSVSKQLSGILKNMKCLEESLQAMDSVLSMAHGDHVMFQQKPNGGRQMCKESSI